MLLMGVLLMLVSSYQLFFQQQTTAQSKVLGELSSTLSVVKIKHALNLDWRDAFVGNGVSENELIFTNPEASAEVSFHEGGKLQIGENSLIRITSTGKDTGLNIEKGIIRAKLEGNRSFHVEMNGKEYELKGKDTEIQINIQEDKGEIGVISGNLTVEKEGLKEELTTQTLLSIEGEEIKKKSVPYKLISPARDTIFYTVGDQFPITFNWTDAEEVTISVSQLSRMKEARTLVGRPGASMDLGPGTYYWKVESSKGPSLVGSFKIVREVTPVLIRPLEGESITVLSGGTQEVMLQWEGTPNQKYKVEWEVDGYNGSKVVDNKALSVPFGAGELLRWRVRIEDDHRPLAIWSVWQNVKIKRLLPPVVPTELTPDGVEYQTYSASDQDVELKWNSIQPVELQLLSPKGTKENKKISVQTFAFKAREAGKYRWRLRGTDIFDRKSEWSEWKTFIIEDMSEQSNMDAQRIQLKRPDQLVKFNWENESGEQTVFELSKDQIFSNVVIKRELTGAETETVIPDTGVYYWRSRKVRPDGSVKMSRPVKVIIEPAPAPAKPQKLPDVEVPIEWKVNDPKTTRWNILDFFISSAHADDITGIVRVEIPSNEDAKEFLIKIFKDEELTELVLEKTIQGTTFEWEGARPGTYYWQYAVIDHWNRKSPFSDLAFLTVTGKEIVKAEKPRLKGPIRASEVDQKDVNFSWSESAGTVEYVLEVSHEEDFSEIIVREFSKDPSVKIGKHKWTPGLYYWRVKARNELKQETVSNTGRFRIRPLLERIIIVDQYANQKTWKKAWRRRAAVAWSPSKDSYSFEDGIDKGRIDGQGLNGLEFKGTEFLENWILSAEILRQSGEVFEGQDYLFQRLFIDGGKNFPLHSGTRISVGLGLGHTTGQEYTVQNNAIKSNSTSDVSVGPVFRSFHPVSQDLEFQTKMLYFMGGVKQLEIGADIIRAWKDDYYMIGGISYGWREYEVGSGEQSSIRANIGLGKEF